MKLKIKNISAIVSCDKDDNVYRNTNIIIDDGLIKSISNDIAEYDIEIDGTDLVAYPGLINTHHHLYQIFTRNISDIQNAELFDWLKFLYEKWKLIDDDTVYLSSQVAIGELMKYGCTTVCDHHYVFPKNYPNLIDMQFEAAKEIGVRMFATRGSMDLSIKDGGLPPDSVVQSINTILKDSERLINKYHDRSFNSMTQIALAPCSPFSVSKNLMVETEKLARKEKVRLHTHLAETKDEERYTLMNFKMRPLEYMDSINWVGNDVWYAHGIHFNDEELKYLAKTSTGIAHCPISNMKLSSGIARVPEMLKLGIPVGLGVDGSASNDGSNLLEEIRVSYLLHRLNSSVLAPSAYDILKMATVGSATLLGRSDIGFLKEGMCGDLFLINKNKLELTGATFDEKSVLSTVGYKDAVEYTIINGKIVVEKGRLTTINEDELVRKSNLKVKELLN